MQDSKINSPWPGPAGLIPVTSGRADDANVHNRRFLDSILLEMRIIDSVKPILEKEIFGRLYASPIMTPAFSHLNKVGKEGERPMVSYARAAKDLNLLNWVGMEPDADFQEILKTGADCVRIIKPFADQQMILDQIAFSEAHQAVAVGVDIDHVPGENGGYDVVDQIPMGPIRGEDLARFVQSTSLPFVAKGVLSVQDAIKARDAGCAAIVVSHHHGRLPFGMPPLALLPAIRKALEGSGMLVFVDCSMDNGYDAYKALALGADAVSVGRGILKPLLQEGREGVVKKLMRVQEELSELMLYTGVSDCQSFDASVLHLPTGMQL